MHTARVKCIWLSAVLSFSVLLAGCGRREGATAQSPADFYRGKLVTIIVPYNPGGGFDQYPRLAQPALKKNLPGSSVVVQNVPGAGGIVGINQLYRSRPDGLTVGLANIAGLIFAAVTGVPGIKYDITKFSWIGRVYSEPRVLAVSAKTGVNSIDELRNLKRPIKLSTTGVGADDYYISIVVFKALGIPLHLATGYEGSQEANLAIMRGEVDCTISSFTAVENAIIAGELKVILFISDKPMEGFEKVPLIMDVADPSQLDYIRAVLHVITLERSFIAAPGVPPERLAYLKEAFSKAYADPEVIGRLAKAKRRVEWLNGELCAQRIGEVNAAGWSLKQDLVNPKY